MKNFILFSFLILMSFSAFSQKKYKKEFYKNGQIKEEGWILNGKKTAYWKFYYKNGNLQKEGAFKHNLEDKYWYFYSGNSSKKKEGHYKNGTKNNWWLFYDSNGNINHKCQLKNNQKNGYCLLYKEQKLVKASKYKNGKKLKEWTDFLSFKDENNLNELRQ
jgi:antitoxin component YwqK of YwqJK toxin-antitoxin module